MARGRPKTPTEILKARGSWRAKGREDEPTGPSGRPRQPYGLSAPEKTAWKKLLDLLEEMGVLTLADEFALERYIRAYGQWRDAMLQLRKEGQVIEVPTREGSVRRPNPYVRIAASWERALRSIESRFGLTPSDRANLVVRKPQGEKPKGRYFGGKAAS